ncbi:MAG TPA: hypothetical protein VJ697_07785 [Nitrososphaeraceae archaeon]|jgi:hypothetical protein|nr:hypothetical protein [Nitrososphaeraceae archaeon]
MTNDNDIDIKIEQDVSLDYKIKQVLEQYAKKLKILIYCGAGYEAEKTRLLELIK